MGTKWPDKWVNFLRNKEESLNLWYFDAKLFLEQYTELYENLNNNAHPEFNTYTRLHRGPCKRV
jgi:hypothetical protein